MLTLLSKSAGNLNKGSLLKKFQHGFSVSGDLNFDDKAVSIANPTNFFIESVLHIKHKNHFISVRLNQCKFRLENGNRLRVSKGGSLSFTFKELCDPLEKSDTVLGTFEMPQNDLFKLMLESPVYKFTSDDPETGEKTHLVIERSKAAPLSHWRLFGEEDGVLLPKLHFKIAQGSLDCLGQLCADALPRILGWQNHRPRCVMESRIVND